MRFRRVTLKRIYVKILLFGTDIDIARFHRIPSREKAKARVQQAVMRMGKRIPVDVRLIVPQCNDAPVGYAFAVCGKISDRRPGHHR